MRKKIEKRKFICWDKNNHDDYNEDNDDDDSSQSEKYTNEKLK
jgi:hypothetical protein